LYFIGVKNMSVLENFSEISSKIYVNGKYSKSTSTNSIEVIDPATENRLGEIPETTESEMKEVISAANKAQKIWNSRSPLDRSHVLHEVANKMSEMAPLFAEALTREMGKPYKETMDEVHWSVHNIRFYAEMGRGETGKVIGSAVEGQFHYTLKQPLGTCVLILPFNYPMVLPAASAALASHASKTIG
jgi:betaine-aldehyde dehydrogenase